MAETIKRVQKQARLLDGSSVPASLLKPIQTKLADLETLFNNLRELCRSAWGLRED